MDSDGFLIQMQSPQQIESGNNSSSEMPDYVSDDSINHSTESIPMSGISTFPEPFSGSPPSNSPKDIASDPSSQIILAESGVANSNFLNRWITWGRNSFSTFQQVIIKGKFQINLKLLSGARTTFTLAPGENLKERDFFVIAKEKFLAEEGPYEIGQDSLSVQVSELEIFSLEGDDLAKLISNFNGPAFMPLDKFLNLKRLHLEKQHLKELPIEITKLPNLHELHLGFNLLRTLPIEIEKLSKLQTLHLQNNKIDIFPRGIANLYELRTLWISNNQLTLLPPYISGLTSLTGLHLHRNKLTTLPIELRNLVCLQKLDLSKNQIRTVPTQALEPLTNLIRLNIRENKLIEVPPSIQNLISLTELDVDCNALTSLLPQVNGLSSLSKLATLNASFNSINVLTPLLGELTALTQLSLSHNRGISSLPLEITKLTNLTKLDFTDNKLTSIPDIKNLGVLKLTNNGLTSFNLTHLHTVRELHVNTNQITALPMDIGLLLNLTELDISCNKLRSIPSSIGLLQKLKRLLAHSNNLTSLPPQLGQLSSIQILQLHNNPDLIVLPREILHLNLLQQLSCANIEVNDFYKEVHIINSDNQKKPKFKQFFAMVRSCPHPLLIFALYSLASDSKNQDTLFQEGLINDVLHMSLINEPRIQLEAVKIISFLSDFEIFHMRLYQEGTIDTMIQLIKSAQVPTACIALHVFGNFGLNDDLRSLIYERYSLDIVKELLTNKSIDEQIKKKARRVLATFGIDPNPSDTRPLRILCLDGGGMKGLATVTILRKLESLCGGKRICDLFDMIVGTSAGGMIAGGLLKRISFDDGVSLYRDLSKKVFVSSQDTENTAWSRLVAFSSGGINMIKAGGYYNSQFFEELLGDQIGRDAMIDFSMEERYPRVFMVSTMVNVFPPEIFLFRNYQYPVNRNVKSRYKGTVKKKIHEAIRATSAAPSYFDDYVDGEMRFQDGALLANNPTSIAFHEAKILFPNRPIKCIVSIGTGREPSRPSKPGLQSIIMNVIESATNGEKIHDMFEDMFSKDVYFRLNPTGPQFECRLDETRKEKLDALVEAATQYAEANTETLMKIASMITEND